MASCRYNGAGFVEVEIHKDLRTASCMIDQRGNECNRLELQVEAQDQVAAIVLSAAEDCTAVLPKLKEEEKRLEEENDGQQSSSLDKDCSENTEPEPPLL